jgi:hypothetical protein
VDYEPDCMRQPAHADGSHRPEHADGLRESEPSTPRTARSAGEFSVGQIDEWCARVSVSGFVGVCARGVCACVCTARLFSLR